jgi:hypothetical protein
LTLPEMRLPRKEPVAVGEPSCVVSDLRVAVD